MHEKFLNIFCTKGGIPAGHVNQIKYKNTKQIILNLKKQYKVKQNALIAMYKGWGVRINGGRERWDIGIRMGNRKGEIHAV